MRRPISFAAALLVASSLFAQDPGYVIAARDGGVWETSIAMSPADPKVAVAIGVIGGGGKVQPFRTDDGGLTWQPGGNLGFTTPTRTYERHGDPVVTAGSDGTFYAATLIGSPKTYPLTYGGIGVFTSRDGGATWDGPFPVVERAPQDKPRYADDKEWITVDDTGGPYDGNLYVSWIRNDTANTQDIASVFSRSTDGGRTWSPETVLGRGAGAQVSVGPNGEVHAIRTCEGFICSQTSRDGGVTFDAPVRIAPSGTFWSNAVDISTGPHRGNLYVAWIASITGPQLTRSYVGTVYFARSTDGGKSWEGPVAITPIGTGTALFQTIAADRVTGEVMLTWLDRRENPTGKKFRLMMTRSTDGGKSFTPHSAVTTAVDMTNNGSGFIGDYNQMDGHGGLFLSAFSDGTGKMGVARIEGVQPPVEGKRPRPIRRP
jgi:hypothetical protein